MQFWDYFQHLCNLKHDDGENKTYKLEKYDKSAGHFKYYGLFYPLLLIFDGQLRQMLQFC